MTSTPQKNRSTHFENPYSESGEAPKKQLDSVEQVPSHVLRERNRHSDIFNREGAEPAAEQATPEPVKPVRSNDVENDNAAVMFRNRNRDSSIFGSSPGAGNNSPSPASTTPTSGTPHKISNIF